MRNLMTKLIENDKLEELNLTELNYLQPHTLGDENYCYININASDNQELIEMIGNFYKKYKEHSFSTNFGGNPIEQMSYMELMIDDIIVTIYPPQTPSGDVDWLSYGKSISKVIVPIQLQINNK